MYPCCRGAGIRDRLEKGESLWNQRFLDRRGSEAVVMTTTHKRMHRSCAAKDAAQDDKSGR